MLEERLPLEIFLTILRLSVGSTQPVTDLVTLQLVCRSWHDIIAGASFLWATINTAEGFRACSKALQVAKNSLLELTCGEGMNKKDRNEFSRLANERADQWKSLVIDVDQWEVLLTTLRTYRPPKLEKLHMASWDYKNSSEDEIILLGGDPAAGLKDFKLNRVVIQLASLQLAGLEALHLQGLPQVSAIEIITIITESPSLKVLFLSQVGGGTMPSQAAAGQSSLVSHSPIRLPFLINLSLIDLPSPFFNLLVSILIVPQLCCLDINCRLEEQPPAEFFAAGLVHLHPTLNSITSNCHKYEVSLSSWGSYDIRVGGLALFIAFSTTCSIIDHFQGAFNWLSSHLDVGLSDLPLHLNLEGCRTELPLLRWFTQRANVTELTLGNDYTFDTDGERMFPLLGYPRSPPWPIWLLPRVQVLNIHMGWGDVNWEIVDMIDRRHSATRAQSLGIGETFLMRFREIRFTYGGRDDTPPSATEEELLSKVAQVAEGANVYWGRRKWTAAVGAD